jgi:N-methylhydantoinase B/oxoprolinase/acetone carboxylase alpha subunit
LIPVSHLARGGVENRDVINFIRHNVRVPDLVLGDLQAQIAANHTSAQALTEFLTEADLELAEIITALQDRSEAALRAAIAKVPDGVYTSRSSRRVRRGTPASAASRSRATASRSTSQARRHNRRAASTRCSTTRRVTRSTG